MECLSIREKETVLPWAELMRACLQFRISEGHEFNSNFCFFLILRKYLEGVRKEDLGREELFQMVMWQSPNVIPQMQPSGVKAWAAAMPRKSCSTQAVETTLQLFICSLTAILK